MSRANANAFPSVVGDPGLTIREHFAGLAMQGLLAQHGDSEPYDTMARWSVAYADALLAELAKALP